MPNTITINFNPCIPAPPAGYFVKYKVLGDTDFTEVGPFTESPAVFEAPGEPGTCYEGALFSDCGGGKVGTDQMWAQCAEGSATSESEGDNSSCGTAISVETASLLYVNLGLFDLNVAGMSHVDLNYDVVERPNRIALYDNGNLVESSGWKGLAPYPGPWGSDLNTAITGTIGFDPVPGHEYKVLVEAGPAGPSPYDLTDNFFINIVCTP